MLGAISQFETKIRAKRQKGVIIKAKELGVKFGKTKYLSDAKTCELKAKREQGIKIKTLMSEFNLSKASIYRYWGGVGAFKNIITLT